MVEDVRREANLGRHNWWGGGQRRWGDGDLRRRVGWKEELEVAERASVWWGVDLSDILGRARSPIRVYDGWRSGDVRLTA